MIQRQIRDHGQLFELQLALVESIPSYGSYAVHLMTKFIEELATLSQRWFAFL